MLIRVRHSNIAIEAGREMIKKLLAVIAVIAALSFTLRDISYAQEKKTAWGKVKSFWQKIFEYPANVTNEAAGVVTEAITGTAKIVTKEVKTVGQVTSGSLEKTGDLVTEPLAGTVETAGKVVEDTVAIPVKAAREEPK